MLILFRISMAAFFSSVLIGAGFAFVRHVRAEAAQAVEKGKQDLKRQQEKAGNEWEGVDVDQLRPADVGVELSAGQIWRIELADLLVHFAAVWISLVVMASIGLAFLLPRARESPSLPPKEASTIHEK